MDEKFKVLSKYVKHRFLGSHGCKSNLCCDPSLGLATKTRACKVAGLRGSLRSHLMFLGVQENVRK